MSFACVFPGLKFFLARFLQAETAFLVEFCVIHAVIYEEVRPAPLDRFLLEFSEA